MPSNAKTPAVLKLLAGADDAGQRIDRWLANKVDGLSRARVQTLIRQGHVAGGATIREPRTPVKPGIIYTVSVPPAEDVATAGEQLPLDIVYEDDDLIVIDKPAGLVVHPAAGHATGTLVNALIAHCGASLSGIGGVRRPGIVHRLDKDTSGLLVVAKTDAAHQSLAAQFKSHGRDGRLHRKYMALIWGTLPRPAGRIEANLARSRVNRLKIAVVPSESGRTAITHYRVIQSFKGSKPAGDVSLLELILETGRTHQIRVHLAHIGHPVLGDPVYGSGFKTRTAALSGPVMTAASILQRQALHASELRFEHPITGEMLSFISPLPPDMTALVGALKERRPPATEAQAKKHSG